MVKVINKNYIGAEFRNAMYAEGYRYYVRGNHRVLPTTDPWSGMPDVESDTVFFTDKAEAEAYAKTQIWVFNPDITATVNTLKEHEETMEETHARLQREAEEAKAKKLAKETAKAEAMGMTLDEYKKFKTLKARKAKLAKKIAELEAELAEAKTKFEAMN